MVVGEDIKGIGLFDMINGEEDINDLEKRLCDYNDDSLYDFFLSNLKEKFRFHVLSLPHTVTREDYCACAYTMKVLKFCKMMKKRGHYIIHYGHEDSVVDCDEHVTLITNKDMEKAYGDFDWKKNFFKHSLQDHCHITFNEKGKKEIKNRLKKKDFVLPFWGKGAYWIVEDIKKDGRAIIVEPGIGYYNSWCDFRIYESYAVLHHTMGLQNSKNPSWYHCVVPNYFDIDNFEFSAEKEDYFLCLGRISKCKGVHIAIQATEKIGKKLVVAGQGDILVELGVSKLPEHVEYVGYADMDKRKKLLKNAKALILLSDYVEPFGGTAVEAMISGTPVIVPDWGVFHETVMHGLTGYRCRTFEQICWAAENCDKINPNDCRNWAVKNYCCARVSLMYEEFFLQLYNLWEKGWYQENKNRKELHWLDKIMP